MASPWFLAPLCIGVGSGVTVAVLGIPKLWTSEAAGWASAAGTSFAALVALGVGLLPENRRRKEALLRVSAQMSVVVSALETQLTHLGRAIEISRQPQFDYPLRVRLFSDTDEIKPESLTGLLSLVEHLTDRCFERTAVCLENANRLQALMRNFRSMPMEDVLVPGIFFTQILVIAYLSIDDARLAYLDHLGRAADELLLEPDEVKTARAARG
ncbi:hypothetical protein [Stenotrophomonas maltophilia]|uniref:Transmembrane protein n=1 Tax=Stenotrophomonas maltophilia TaxID=40324 RepID=A0AAJ2JES3_STEMA|nr:hypothetical protein [Stenotrophomonas maltophilia]MDT3468652.1 hypothetical protein [Stenotrophomonas maltophilia]